MTQVKSVKAQKSILADLGGRSSDGVVGVQLTWKLPGNEFSGLYSFLACVRIGGIEDISEAVCERLIYKAPVLILP